MPPHPPKRRVTYTLPEWEFPVLKAGNPLICKPEAEFFLGLHFVGLAKPGGTLEAGNFSAHETQEAHRKYISLGGQNQYPLFVEAAGRNIPGYHFRSTPNRGGNQFPPFLTTPGGGSKQ